VTILTTPRLTLRPFAASDAADFQRLAGDWDIARMTSDIPYPLDEAGARHWLTPATEEQRFAVCRDDMLIGGVGTFRRASGVGELGFWLGSAWWGQGLATEAASAVIAYGLATDAYSSFSSSHFEDNPASRRVLEKLGFKPAGQGEIWSVARRASVPTQWLWLPLERARELHGDAARLQATKSRGWSTALLGRLVRTS
jgi:RimJ/RimL family protein N-acetyltransferase